VDWSVRTKMKIYTARNPFSTGNYWIKTERSVSRKKVLDYYHSGAVISENNYFGILFDKQKMLVYSDDGLLVQE
jgi:hypothetical protein